MKLYELAILITTLLAGCGDDGSGPTPIDAAVIDAAAIDAAAIDARPIDAGLDARMIDAAPATVVVVPCAGAAIASDVTAPGFAYTITDNTVAVNAIVRFTMPGIHNAISGTVSGGMGTADGQFRVDFSQTKCLRFTAAGTFPFYCGPHLFTGSLTVGP